MWRLNYSAVIMWTLLLSYCLHRMCAHSNIMSFVCQKFVSAHHSNLWCTSNKYLCESVFFWIFFDIKPKVLSITVLKLFGVIFIVCSKCLIFVTVHQSFPILSKYNAKVSTYSIIVICLWKQFSLPSFEFGKSSNKTQSDTKNFKPKYTFFEIWAPDLPSTSHSWETQKSSQ